MLDRLYRKNELTFSLAWIFGYVALSALADNLSDLLGFSKIITALAHVFGALLLGIWLHKHGLSHKYGLCAFNGRARDYLYFLPLLLILATNLRNGVALNASATEIVLYVISMLCVGWIEEILFRGFLFKAIAKENITQAILISSITFGLGHVVNGLNGADWIPTLLQISYASANGFLFTILFYKSQSLLPCIIVHGIFNSLSIFSVADSTLTRHILSSVVLCVICIAYALWILKRIEFTHANTLLP